MYTFVAAQRWVTSGWSIRRESRAAAVRRATRSKCGSSASGLDSLLPTLSSILGSIAIDAPSLGWLETVISGCPASETHAEWGGTHRCPEGHGGRDPYRHQSRQTRDCGFSCGVGRHRETPSAKFRGGPVTPVVVGDVPVDGEEILRCNGGTTAH